MLIQQHNCETNEIIVRELTIEEMAQRNKDEAEAAERLIETQAKAAARQAILDRLGLTEEEARLLLG